MKRMFGRDKIDDDKEHRVRKADICLVLVILAATLVSFLIIKLQSTKGSYAVVSYDGETLLGQISLEKPDPVYYLLTYESSDEQSSNNTDNIDKSDMYINSTLRKSSTLNNNSALDKRITLDNGITIQKYSETEWETVSLPNIEYNVFICSDNEIRMLQSSCPDKICVHHSAISKTGENIICLPHKLVIEIKGGKENDLDGVAY